MNNWLLMREKGGNKNLPLNFMKSIKFFMETCFKSDFITLLKNFNFLDSLPYKVKYKVF